MLHLHPLPPAGPGQDKWSWTVLSISSWMIHQHLMNCFICNLKGLWLKSAKFILPAAQDAAKTYSGRTYLKKNYMWGGWSLNAETKLSFSAYCTPVPVFRVGLTEQECTSLHGCSWREPHSETSAAFNWLFLLTFSGVGQPSKSLQNLWISYLIGELACQDFLWVSEGFRRPEVGLKGTRGCFHFNKASYPSIKVCLLAASLRLVHHACHLPHTPGPLHKWFHLPGIIVLPPFHFISSYSSFWFQSLYHFPREAFSGFSAWQLAHYTFSHPSRCISVRHWP